MKRVNLHRFFFNELYTILYTGSFDYHPESQIEY